MFSKCTMCGSRIIAGAEVYLDKEFCSGKCLRKFQNGLIEKLIPAEVVDGHIQQAFAGPCPQCHQESGGNDVYSSSTVTGLLVFHLHNSQQKLSCQGCASKQRLFACLHCMFLGWWGVKAAITNLFILPANLFGAVFVHRPTEPSAELRKLVRGLLAENVIPQLLAARRATGVSDVPDDDPEDPGYEVGGDNAERR